MYTCAKEDAIQAYGRHLSTLPCCARGTPASPASLDWHNHRTTPLASAKGMHRIVGPHAQQHHLWVVQVRMV